MEDLKMKKEEEMDETMWVNIEKADRRGKIVGGLLIVAAGGLFLAREMEMNIPEWVFSWKMLLIGLGLILAVKHKLRHPGWIFLMGIGGAFLLNDLQPEWRIKPFLWPSLLILAGLFVIFKPRRRRFNQYRKHWRKFHRHHHYRHHHAKQHYYQDFCNREESSTDEFIDSTVFMAGVKKIILSKNFKGGDLTNVFGGTELNLSQADFEERANLEVTQVFGGTKLIVPANWEIRSELVTVFGSVEDKRPSQAKINPENGRIKTLVLTGTTFFGGIEIRSF